ncbi:MAG TPA: MFS transporter [Pseudonocardiaceae bacterium]|jgi:EmrB/QacA subfamily drug resistance transporter
MTWPAVLLRESPRPRRIATAAWAPGLVVATVCIGAFMGQLDASIVSLALPAIGHDLHADSAQTEWVALGYLLTLVSLVAPVGRLADTIGRKLLYTYGFGVFALASLACGLAPNLAVLDIFRVVQALGAAMLQANSVALIATAVPRRVLGRAVGIQGAAQAVGLALGPAAGGLLLQLGSWRLLFLLTVPAGVLGVVTGWFFLPRSRDLVPRRPVDWRGLGLFAPAVALLMLALSLATRSEPPALLAALVVVAAMLGVLFVWHARRAAAPLLDLNLLRRKALRAGLGSGLLSYTAMFGLLFTAPLALGGAYHLTSGRSGLVLTLLPVALGLTAPFAGRLADRFGARAVTVCGMAVATVGLVGIAALHPGVTTFAVLLVVIGIGLGLFTPANNAAVMASAPACDSGSAAGVLNMTRGLGTALGIAAATLVFSAAGMVAVGWFLAVLTVLGALLAVPRDQPSPPPIT